MEATFRRNPNASGNQRSEFGMYSATGPRNTSWIYDESIGASVRLETNFNTGATVYRADTGASDYTNYHTYTVTQNLAGCLVLIDGQAVASAGTEFSVGRDTSPLLAGLPSYFYFQHKNLAANPDSYMAIQSGVLIISSKYSEVPTF